MAVPPYELNEMYAAYGMHRHDHHHHSSVCSRRSRGSYIRPKSYRSPVSVQDYYYNTDCSTGSTKKKKKIAGIRVCSTPAQNRNGHVVGGACTMVDTASRACLGKTGPLTVAWEHSTPPSPTALPLAQSGRT